MLAQDIFFEWVRTCIMRSPFDVLDGNGLNVMGNRPGSCVCAKWPQYQGEDRWRFNGLTYTYKAGGFDHSFELCKLTTMSAFSPPAIGLASREATDLANPDRPM